MPISPVDKIHIYQKFHIDRSLLAESFAKLIVRPEPLNLEEGKKLELDTTLQISRARELSRGSNSGTKSSPIQVNDSDLRSVIRDAFDFEEEPPFDFLVGVLFFFFQFYEDLTDVFCRHFDNGHRINRSRHRRCHHIPPPSTRVDAKTRGEQLRRKLARRCATMSLRRVPLGRVFVFCGIMVYTIVATRISCVICFS